MQKIQGYYFLVLLLALSSLPVFAQTGGEKAYPHQLGINATAFIKQFSPSSFSFLPDNPYILTYKYIGAKNIGLRAGLGGAYQFKKATQNSNPGLTPDTLTAGLYARLGFEWQFFTGKRWVLYGGADVRYENDVNQSVMEVSKTQSTTRTKSKFKMGGGPVLGVEYKLAPRVSLNAEAAVLYMYHESHDSIEDSLYPSLKTDNYTAENEMTFSSPTTIYFIFKL